MNENIKNYLGITLIGALIMLVLVAFTISSTYEQSAGQRSFEVLAQGKAVIIPDIAQFTYSVLTEGGKDVAALQKENTSRANKVNEYLTSQSIDKKDIQTQNYNVQPRYQYSNCVSDKGVCPPPEIIGYSVSQGVLVKVRNVGKAGDLLTGVITSGANSVSQLSFTVDDRTKIENEARAQAMQKAKEKAQLIADAGGFNLGKLLSINETSNEPVPYPLYGIGGGAPEMAKALPIPIEPGSQEIQVTVTLKYEIR